MAKGRASVLASASTARATPKRPATTRAMCRSAGTVSFGVSSGSSPLAGLTACFRTANRPMAPGGAQ
eukprot:3183154-Alexandrium_andersonii.AAC.1